MPSLEAPPAGSTDSTTRTARIQLGFDDGTHTIPALDQDLEDRLEYIVDNIVRPPSDPSS
ncbi:MAG: hypothetical protein M3N53_10750 [Actinomycetota bacterium]|nr:hypothetical protein [Actinomycetota bacterium]